VGKTPVRELELKSLPTQKKKKGRKEERKSEKQTKKQTN